MGGKAFHRRPGAMGRKGRTVFEALVVLLLVSILLLLAADKYMTSVRFVREAALRLELSNLRTGVTFYTMLKRRLPPSLKELVKENAVIAEKDLETGAERVVVMGRYVEAMRTDAEGNPSDPFGNAYLYDPNSGKVRSSTPGYEAW